MENIVKIVERRARKQLSKAKIFKDCSIQLTEDDSCNSVVNAFLLNKFVTITSNVSPNIKTSDFLSLPTTATTKAGQLLDKMLLNKKHDSHDNTIQLLVDSTDAEIQEYAKIMSLNCIPSKPHEVVDAFEKMHIGSEQSLAKSADFINNS